jgi:hypothetical protein
MEYEKRLQAVKDALAEWNRWLRRPKR